MEVRRKRKKEKERKGRKEKGRSSGERTVNFVSDSPPVEGRIVRSDEQDGVVSLYFPEKRIKKRITPIF